MQDDRAKGRQMTNQFSRYLLEAEPAQAQEIIAELLSKPVPDLALMGELAANLFANARFSLAAMVFARWADMQPSNPEPWSNLGLCMLHLREVDKARQLFEYALEIDPEFHAARHNLGDAYKELGLQDKQLENAMVCVEKTPDSATARNNLGTALQDLGRAAEARQAFAHSLAIDPDNFEARFNLARLASDDGDTALATAFFESVLSVTRADPKRRDLVEYHLSYEYLTAGRLLDGWRLYERGFSPNVPLSIARRPDRQFDVPRWDGRPLDKGQTLMIWREQGIGDEIRFLTLLPLADLGAGKLIIETEPRLVNLFQRSFPDALVRVQQMSEAAGGTQMAKDYDFHMPVGSLPGLLMKDKAIYNRLGSYLKADAGEKDRFASRMTKYVGMRKVGICWRSHQLSAKRNRKYTALRDWAEVLVMPDTIFVNLQYGDCEAEIRAIEKELGIDILRWPDVDLKNDLEAVLGIMDNLDLVISPSTAVLPLAGALGRPTIYLGQRTWVLLGERETYPWFRSVSPLIVEPTIPVSNVLSKVGALAESMLSS